MKNFWKQPKENKHHIPGTLTHVMMLLWKPWRQEHSRMISLGSWKRKRKRRIVDLAVQNSIFFQKDGDVDAFVNKEKLRVLVASGLQLQKCRKEISFKLKDDDFGEKSDTYRKRWHTVGCAGVNMTLYVYFKKYCIKVLHFFISSFLFCPWGQGLTWELKARELKPHNRHSHHQTWWQEQPRMHWKGPERASPGGVPIETVLPAAPVRATLPSAMGENEI